MSKTMLTNVGTGNELRKLLMEKLNIPSQATCFEVRFALHEPVQVKVEYWAAEPDLPTDTNMTDNA